MFRKVIAFSFLLISSDCITTSVHEPENSHGPDFNNMGEYDCCPLVWKPLIETPLGMFVPPDVVVAGYDATHGDKYYFTMLPFAQAGGIFKKVFGKASAHVNYKYDQDTEDRFEKYVRTGRMDTQSSTNTFIRTSLSLRIQTLRYPL